LGEGLDRVLRGNDLLGRLSIPLGAIELGNLSQRFVHRGDARRGFWTEGRRDAMRRRGDARNERDNYDAGPAGHRHYPARLEDCESQCSLLMTRRRRRLHPSTLATCQV
jgi:hypothetical protein